MRLPHGQYITITEIAAISVIYGKRPRSRACKSRYRLKRAEFTPSFVTVVGFIASVLTIADTLM